MIAKSAHVSTDSSAVVTKITVWPAIIATFLIGYGFGALKFVLIGRIALDFDPSMPGAMDHMPAWWREITVAADHRGGLKEALSQGLSAILTLGLIIGFPINGPLAGAWNCRRLFAVSFACTAIATLLTLWSNPWLWAAVVGIVYGTGCAARGKVIPLLSQAVGQSNTLICGSMNAALAIGLLIGSLVGSILSEIESLSHLQRHLCLLGFAGVGFCSAWFVRVPEPPPVPIMLGMKDFFSSTRRLFRSHWPLLVGGGLSWGVTAACSLAIYVHAVDALHMKRSHAVTLILFAGIGAIIGNLISHWGARRRWVIIAFIVQAVVICVYPYVVHGYWMAAALICIIAMLFAAPANILDAKFLANAHESNLSGLGSTIMGFTHSVCILAISLTLAIPLLLGKMPAEAQFPVLAVIAVLSCGAAACSKLSATIPASAVTDVAKR